MESNLQRSSLVGTLMPSSLFFIVLGIEVNIYMSKKCYVVGVLVFCLIIFSFLICLGCGGSITLPVITIEWKKIKDASDCCCCGGDGNLWAAISGIASLIMGILAFLAWRQSIKARFYSSFETLYASLLAQQRNLFENPSIS